MHNYACTIIILYDHIFLRTYTTRKLDYHTYEQSYFSLTVTYFLFYPVIILYLGRSLKELQYCEEWVKLSALSMSMNGSARIALLPGLNWGVRAYLSSLGKHAQAFN